MNIVLLIFIILNASLLGLFVPVVIEANTLLRDVLNSRGKQFTDYKKRFPIKSKFKLGDIVFYKSTNFTYNGKIVAVIHKYAKESTCIEIQYMIEYEGRTITANECDLFLEKHSK